MATFRRFEDIQAWQKARIIVKEIYLKTENGRFAADFDLKRQVRRSAVSISANIAEGQGRRTDKDFANFLNMSIGSISETKSHLYLAFDLGYLERDVFEELYGKLDEVGKMVLL